MSDKLNKRVKELAATIILTKLSDPRIKFVTVLGAKFSPDLRYCTIYISILGTESQTRTTMRGLQHARGFIQRMIASHLALRHAPIIKIEHDTALEKSQHISELINKISENEENEENAIESPIEENATGSPIEENATGSSSNESSNKEESEEEKA